MRWLIRHWKINIALVLGMCVVAFFAVPDKGSAGLGLAVGAGGAAAFVLALIFFFPRAFTRDPEKQAQNAKFVLPGAGIGLLGLGLIRAFADSWESAILGVCVGFLAAMTVWRVWFETSEYARRRWPKAEAVTRG